MRSFKGIILGMAIILILNGCSANKSLSVAVHVPPEEAVPEIEYLVPPQFNQTGLCFIDGVLMVTQDTEGVVKQGYINEKGELIAPPIYEETQYYTGMHTAGSGFSEGLAPVKKGEKWGYIDKSGKEIIPFRFEEASLFEGGAAAVKLGEKYGFIDKAGKMLIAPQYETALIRQGVGIVQQEGLWHFIAMDGSLLLKEGFKDIELPMLVEENSHYIKVVENQLYGLIRLQEGRAEYLVEPRYYKLFPFIDGRAFYIILHRDAQGAYTKQKDYGYIDENGKELYRWKNTRLDIFGLWEDRILAQDGMGMYGYLDPSMKVIVPFQYEEASEYCQGRALVRMDGRYGIIDKSGGWILKPEYQSLVDMGSYFIVQDEEGTYLMDAVQKRPLSRKYDEIGRGETLKPVRLGGKVGFINLTGEEVIRPQYEDCETFAFWDDHAIVTQGDKWFYIDKSGSRQGDLSFEEAGVFNDEGYAAVKNNGKWGVLKKYGELVIPCVFEEVAIQPKGLAIVRQEGKYGIVKLK